MNRYIEKMVNELVEGCTYGFLVDFVVAALKCLPPFAKTIS